MSDLYDPELLSALGLTPYDSEGEILARLNDVFGSRIDEPYRGRVAELSEQAASPIVQSLRNKAIEHINEGRPLTRMLQEAAGSPRQGFRLQSSELTLPEGFEDLPFEKKKALLERQDLKTGEAVADRQISKILRAKNPLSPDPEGFLVERSNLRDAILSKLGGYTVSERQDILDSFLGEDRANLTDRLERMHGQAFEPETSHRKLALSDPENARALAFREMQRKSTEIEESPILKSPAERDYERGLDRYLRDNYEWSNPNYDFENDPHLSELHELQRDVIKEEGGSVSPKFEDRKRDMRSPAGRRLSAHDEMLASGNFFFNKKTGQWNADREKDFFKDLVEEELGWFKKNDKKIFKKISDELSSNPNMLPSPLFQRIVKNSKYQKAWRSLMPSKQEYDATSAASKFDRLLKRDWAPGEFSPNRAEVTARRFDKFLRFADKAHPRIAADVVRSVIEEVSRQDPQLADRLIDSNERARKLLMSEMGFKTGPEAKGYSSSKADDLLNRAKLSLEEGKYSLSELYRKAAYQTEVAETSMDPVEKTRAANIATSTLRGVDSLYESGNTERYATRANKEIGLENIDATDVETSGEEARILGRNKKELDPDVLAASMEGQDVSRQIDEEFAKRAQMGSRGGLERDEFGRPISNLNPSKKRTSVKTLLKKVSSGIPLMELPRGSLRLQSSKPSETLSQAEMQAEIEALEQARLSATPSKGDLMTASERSASRNRKLSGELIEQVSGNLDQRTSAAIQDAAEAAFTIDRRRLLEIVQANQIPLSPKQLAALSETGLKNSPIDVVKSTYAEIGEQVQKHLRSRMSKARPPSILGLRQMMLASRLKGSANQTPTPSSQVPILQRLSRMARRK